ncbi:MAG TPA: sigma factor-like helix-turn-helix DNA-binding protein [Candidatus Saccharimonadales bacterium]|nr:sigma factor-like helix-turn-helix DNA-binding protein [Candidatus Saccharimonadales bacterium]
MSDVTDAPALDINSAVKDILSTIEREREREIIARRFGLYDRKETLEQIGELLGITRERVRQLEKAIMIRLKIAAEDSLPHIDRLEKVLVRNLYDLGGIARVTELTSRTGTDNSDRDRAHVAFIAELAPRLAVVEENDLYHHSVGLKEQYDEKQIKKFVDEIVGTIKTHGQPLTADELHEKVNHNHPDHVRALASVSKNLANLKGKWGLTKWPTVNPKNIRDKIYVILSDHGKPMHFSDIAKAIKDSDFKRKDVTTQAIHNELIKDGRFVLIGRGIYALKEWGFQKGTVADIISDILKKEGGPLHRDEIVKRVLKHRQVKETTILLNLQGKSRFKRVAKATYTLAEPEAA